MRVAIRFAMMNLLPAEFKGLIANMARRPSALVRSKISKTKTVWVVGFLLGNRVRPSLKTETVRFANDRITADIKPLANLSYQ